MKRVWIDMPSIARGYSQAMCPYCNAIVKHYKDFKCCPNCGKQVGKEQTDEK